MRVLILLLISSFLLTAGIPKKEIINTENAPEAIGPYSQAVLVGNTLYASGQIAIDPKTNEFIGGDIEQQTRQVMENLKAVLKASDMDLENVVSVTVYLSDLNNYKKFNSIYAEYFKANPPARATVEVARLPKDALVEISLIAKNFKN